MRFKSALASVAATALAVTLPSVAHASAIISFDAASPVPGVNDFSAQLASLGLTRFATTGASIVLDADDTILFEFLGSESYFDDALQAPGLLYTETSSIEDHFAAPIFLGSADFAAGSLAGLLNFLSSGGNAATVGDDGFGIFLGPNQVSGEAVSTFYLGFDDQITNQDDNHDDFIVRATLQSAVPEPGTWAMLLIGFGAVGFGMRRRAGKVRERRVSYSFA